MRKQPHSRQTLDIAQFVESVRPGSIATQYPMEFAPAALIHDDLGLLAGQQLWSLPLPIETLDHSARAAQADILMFRDMKDRNPLMSVRCDASIWVGDSLLILRDLIPHYSLTAPPSFMNPEQSPAVVLTASGLVLAPHPTHSGFRQCVEGFDLATRILLGQSRFGFAA